MYLVLISPPIKDIIPSSLVWFALSAFQIAIRHLRRFSKFFLRFSSNFTSSSKSSFGGDLSFFSPSHAAILMEESSALSCEKSAERISTMRSIAEGRLALLPVWYGVSSRVLPYFSESSRACFSKYLAISWGLQNLRVLFSSSKAGLVSLSRWNSRKRSSENTSISVISFISL